MKKKILTIVVSALVLILPSVVAILFYSHAQNNPVTRSAVSRMEVSAPDGNTYTYVKTDKAEKALFDRFFDMNENAEGVPSLPAPASDYEIYTARYQSYNRSFEYAYYFSQDPKNAFYHDDDGKYYRIDSAYAGKFLETEYASCLFPASAQPVLSVGETASVLPVTQVWKYLGYNGAYFDSTVSTSDDIGVCDVSGGLQLLFDLEPDYLFVTMKNTEGQTVFEDVLENMDPGLYAENIRYDVSILARWYQSEGRNSYGEAEYHFVANVLSPAVFYLNKPSTEYGNFVVISAKNIVDPMQIRFRSEPEIYFTPKFFEYGGYHHALIPFSIVCEELNNKASEYDLSLSYGGVEQVLHISVASNAIKKAYSSISTETIRNHRTETTIAAFQQTMAEPFGTLLTDIFFTDDSMLIPPVADRKIKIGFGLQVILNNGSGSTKTYRHEGVDYSVKSNDPVVACLPGRVAFVGETRLSGNTVVVDHGGGLKSLYAHLSSTGVSVGDIVEKNQIIGIVGSTGFTDNRNLHFGLYVFDVPVRYYVYENEGIHFAEAVEKAIAEKKGTVIPTETVEE